MVKYHTIMNHKPNHSKAVFTICMSVVLWIGVCVGIWFLSRSVFQKEIVNMQAVQQYCLRVTLVLGIQEFLLMLWAMLEYLLKFHNVRQPSDRYKWYVTPVAVTAVAFISMLITNSAVFAVGWVTVIQMAGILAVIFVPRLFFQPV